jgi:hypothetical protein
VRYKIPKIRFTESLVLTISIAAVLLFVVWQLASPRVVPSSRVLQDEVRFLSTELESISNRMERLQARQAVLEQETEVMRRANRLLREHESKRQAELGRLQSELDFYSRLSGTSGTQAGLDVYRAEIISTESDRVFQFVLTLTQNIRRAAIISGRARLDLEGTLDDRPVTLHWSQLSDGETPEPAFRFKYFQQLEGYLTLPEGFSPTRLLVTLEAKGQRKPIIRHYGWDELHED